MTRLRPGLLILALLLAGTFSFLPRPAQACTPYTCCFGICEILFNEVETEFVNDFFDNRLEAAVQVINYNTTLDFQLHQLWMVNTYFKGNPDSSGRRGGILTAMMKMTEQFSAIAMQQMETVGLFLDAQNQTQTQRLYQQLAAQAHKDYYPSEGLCSIGSAARNLQGAERTGDVTALALMRRSQGRQLKNANTIAADGEDADRDSRRKQFLKTFCDKNDSNLEIGESSICDPAVPAARKNKDIDFARTLWNPLSVNLNFTSGGATASSDTEDVSALQLNLYAHDVFAQPSSPAALAEDSSKLASYLDLRAIVAKRSVAENTFAALAAMKTAGSPDATGQYFWAAYKELNPAITDAEAKAVVGTNPSYWAQMDVLTKATLQNPQFYTDLYDKPANVERKRVALQAISLVQERDNYKVTLRSEMLWSMLLEMKLMEAQSEVQGQLMK